VYQTTHKITVHIGVNGGQQHAELDGYTEWNAHNTVFGSKRN